MTITMNDSHMVSIAQIKEFIKVSKDIEFTATSRTEKYQWIETVLGRFKYFSLRKKGKILADSTKRHRFTKTYTPEDVAALIETDKAHDRLSGQATRRIFERMHDIFKDTRFQRLKTISTTFGERDNIFPGQNSSPKPSQRRLRSGNGESLIPRENPGFCA